MTGDLSPELAAELAEILGPPRDCPGCVGRGTGATCCVCDRPIPPALRRSVDSPSEVRDGCPSCRLGRPHFHRFRAEGEDRPTI